MVDAPERDPLAIICGGGSFPGAVAEAVARRGRRPVMFAVFVILNLASDVKYSHAFQCL